MNFSVYIRPLQLEDALISCHWRNNPRIWEHTGSKPDQLVTEEMETKWLAGVLQRKNEKRFAICLKKDDRYIGNIYLTDITDKDAQVHIFIGDVAYWGKKKAFEATYFIALYAFYTLQLKELYAEIKDSNKSTNALAKTFGGATMEAYYDEEKCRTIQKWIFTREMFEGSMRSLLSQSANPVS